MSEFKNYINSSIFVETTTSKQEVDDWGNLQPQTEIIEIKAWLKELRGNSQTRPGGNINEQQGVNTFSTYLKGYLAKPSQWPNNVVPKFCEVNYLGRRGKLQVYSQLPRVFDTEKLTGAAVEGMATFQL
jgi:hypothetical protein